MRDEISPKIFAGEDITRREAFADFAHTRRLYSISYILSPPIIPTYACTWPRKIRRKTAEAFSPTGAFARERERAHAGHTGRASASFARRPHAIRALRRFLPAYQAASIYVAHAPAATMPPARGTTFLDVSHALTDMPPARLYLLLGTVDARAGLCARITAGRPMIIIRRRGKKLAEEMRADSRA